MDMDRERLVHYLDQPRECEAALCAAHLRHAAGPGEPDRHRHSGRPPDLLAILCQQLAEQLPALSDPDMALNNLDRFFAAARNPLALASLFERDPEALPTLLQIFSTSQYLSDLLIRDPESFDLLRMTEGQPVAREVLVQEICATWPTVDDDRDILTILRRHKHRETLRIAYGDIVLRQRVEIVTEQISFLADAIWWRRPCRRRGGSWSSNAACRGGRTGSRPRFVVLALGKLGGVELNYSSDIDLIFLSDDVGKTAGRGRSATASSSNGWPARSSST